MGLDVVIVLAGIGCSYVELMILSLADCETQPQLRYMSCCAGADHRKQNSLQQTLVLLVKLIGSCSVVV